MNNYYYSTDNDKYWKWKSFGIIMCGVESGWDDGAGLINQIFNNDKESNEGGVHSKRASPASQLEGPTDQ